jgi:uncharacterized protein involved in outer membrane biogenesis
MLKKVVAGLAILLVVISAILYFWAHSIFSSDLVRTRVAAQMAAALGQPVDIGTIGATIFPRVTMSLGQVRIGNPARITIARLDVGTALRALLSRRIDEAAIHLSGARIELPLPPFTIGSGAAAAETADDEPAVTIESIDEIVLRDVEIVSGGRSLRGNVEVVPHGSGMTIRTMTLGIGDTNVEVAGEIADFDGPVGTITVKAGALNMLDLLAFASEFAAGATTGTSSAGGPAAPGAAGGGAPRTPMDISVALDAERAAFGTLILDSLGGRARLTREALTFDPVTFRLFDGSYDGRLELGLGDTPQFRMRAALANVDMAALTAFAGTPDALTGRLAGTLDVTSRGTSPDRIISDARGRARVDITHGTVKGLGLVRTVVIATSMRADAAPQAAPDTSAPEPFTRLGATLNIANGAARTDDLAFESNDLLLLASGQVGLDGNNIDLDAQVQLSDALSKQAGRDLVRYTQADGRVTLPATISGSASQLSVRIDMGSVLKRAITNKATEEAEKAIRRGLSDLFGGQRAE